MKLLELGQIRDYITVPGKVVQESPFQHFSTTYWSTMIQSLAKSRNTFVANKVLIIISNFAD